MCNLLLQGIYTIRMKIKSLLNAVSSVYTGSYKGSITVKHGENLLSCYDYSFDIVDRVEEIPFQPTVVLIH